MFIKYIIPLIIAIGSSYISIGQQQIHYTQFLNNKLWMNPAYAGSHDHLSIQAISRNQWIGLDGAPSTSALSVHSSLRNKDIGIGMTITADEAGPMNSLSFTGNYAYSIYEKDKFQLCLGLQSSIMRYSLDFRDIRTTSAGDQSFLEEPASMNLFNFGAGIYAQSDRLFFGISVPFMVSNGLAFNEINGIQRAQQDIHVYIMTGYLFRYNEDIDLKSAVLIKYLNNAPLDVDFNLSTIFDNRLWAGFNYRLGGNEVDFLGESLDLILQYQVSSRARLGLSYDYTIGEFQFASSGTLEFLAHYVFRDKDDVGKSNQYF